MSDELSYAESHKIRPTSASAGAMLALAMLAMDGPDVPVIRRPRRKRYGVTPDHIDRGPKVRGKVRNLPCPKCGAKLKRHEGGKCPVKKGDR